jgi:hypothetical protein
VRGALAGVGRRSLLSKVEDKANEVSQNTIGKVDLHGGPLAALWLGAGHVPRLIRSASFTSQSSWWSLDLCSSVLFPTLCYVPKISFFFS